MLHFNIHEAGKRAIHKALANRPHPNESIPQMFTHIIGELVRVQLQVCGLVPAIVEHVEHVAAEATTYYWVLLEKGTHATDRAVVSDWDVFPY